MIVGPAGRGVRCPRSRFLVSVGAVAGAGTRAGDDTGGTAREPCGGAIISVGVASPCAFSCALRDERRRDRPGFVSAGVSSGVRTVSGRTSVGPSATSAAGTSAVETSGAGVSASGAGKSAVIPASKAAASSREGASAFAFRRRGARRGFAPVKLVEPVASTDSVPGRGRVSAAPSVAISEVSGGGAASTIASEVGSSPVGLRRVEARRRRGAASVASASAGGAEADSTVGCSAGFALTASSVVSIIAASAAGASAFRLRAIKGNTPVSDCGASPARAHTHTGLLRQERFEVLSKGHGGGSRTGQPAG